MRPEPSPPSTDPDQAAIDRLADEFFRVFCNRGGTRPRLERLRELFLPEGVIIKHGGAGLEVYNLDTFIAPRERLLNDGTLLEFEEEEEESRTAVCGAVAQRLSLYRKSGIMAGRPFRSRGVKTAQLVRTPAGWKFSAVAWDDEREGFQVPDRLPSPAGDPV